MIFARDTAKELLKLKRFNPGDKWVNEINEYFRMHLYDKVSLPITETTRKIVLKIIQQGQQEGWGVEKIVSFIQKETKEMSRTRTRTIVRTETGRAANLGKWIAAQDFQFVTNKTWISAGDRRVRPQPSFSPDAANHIVLNEETTGLDKPFSNGLLFPGDPNGEAGETINCRCTIVFETVKDAQGRPIPKVNAPRYNTIPTNAVQNAVTNAALATIGAQLSNLLFSNEDNL